MDKDIKEIAEYWADHFDDTPSMEDKSAEAEAYRLAQYILNPWIPVSERLPEDGEDNFSIMVLVRIVGGSQFVAWYDHEMNCWESDNGLPEPPIAWSYLPPIPDKE